MDALRIGIVGCGRISEMYLQVFKDLGDSVEVKFAADKVKEKAEAFASNFSGCKALTDYREGLGDIDVLHIATPHYLHCEMAIAAMEKGVNVLTEKPIAISLEQADMMIETAKKTGVKFGVIFQTRYVKGCMELKRVIEEGKIGKILAAKSYLSWNREKAYYESSDWKGTWDKEGGGVLIDQAIHSIDRVRFLVGSDIDWIEGSMTNRRHQYIKVEDTAEAFIMFKNGCEYTLYACNSFGYDSPIEIEIFGEKGKVGLKQDLAWVDIKGEDYYEIREGYDSIVVGKGYWGSSHITQVKDFYNAVRNDTEIFIDGLEGRKTLELILGIYESAKENKRVVIS